jgi:hypothetical protein
MKKRRRRKKAKRGKTKSEDESVPKSRKKGNAA